SSFTQLNNLAVIANLKGDLTQAHTLLHQALEISKNNQEQPNKANPEFAFLYGNLAIINAHQKNYKKAKQQAKKSLILADLEPHKSPKLQRHLYGLLAMIAYQENQFAHATRHILKALKLSHLSESEQMAVNFANLGALTAQNGNLDEAYEHFSEALLLFEQILSYRKNHTDYKNASRQNNAIQNNIVRLKKIMACFNH
ncbi:MAG: tetratricopeptide repeat protein, partial [Pseudomonadota bacterium]